MRAPAPPPAAAPAPTKGNLSARADELRAQFAQFYRSLEAYRASFNKKSDVMVVDPSSDFFKAMRSSGVAPPAIAAPSSATAPVVPARKP